MKQKTAVFPLRLIIYNVLCYLKNEDLDYSEFIVAQGRWGPSLLPDCFGIFQNVLRIILDASPSLGTEPKEVCPQRLIRNYSSITP